MATSNSNNSNVNGTFKKSPDFMEKVKAFRNDPMHKGSLITPVVVMEYAAAKAKFLSGLIGKTPFSGDINKAVDSDVFLSGLQHTAASGLDASAIKNQIKFAAKTFTSQRSALNNTFIKVEQNAENTLSYELKKKELLRKCGLMAIKAFPSDIQAQSADFKRLNAIKESMEKNKEQVAKPSDASLEADAFLSGKTPTFSKSAFKSHISKLYWQLCRAPETVASIVSSDKMFNAPKEAYADADLFEKREQIMGSLCHQVTETVTALKNLDPSVPNFKQTELATIRKGFFALGSVIGNVKEAEIEKKLNKGLSNEPQMYVKVSKEDVQSHKAIRALGGHWVKDLTAWAVPERNIGQLNLGGKGEIFKNADDLKAGKALSTNVQQSAKQEPEETLSGGMSM